jgi:hypothetical protein
MGVRLTCDAQRANALPNPGPAPHGHLLPSFGFENNVFSIAA